MPENILIMNKNIPVVEFNFDEGYYSILNNKLLPFQLKGKINNSKEILPNMSKYELTQAIITSQKNYNAVLAFLSSRVLSLTRENAKKIYNLFGFEQLQDDLSKAKIAITCRAVSLQDNYWVKLKSDPTKWEDIDLRTNSLSETVAQVSLHGSSLTLQGKVCTPELNGQGAYAKAWKRENGKLFLLKKGTNKKIDESKIEVCVSKLLDKCNVEHVKYEDAVSSIINERYEEESIYVCKCECMSTEKLSILPGLDFISYCNTNGMSPDIEMKKIDEESIYKMWIVDYLISNGDRHGMNWGFYYDADTMEILKCHPLYDHNNAFDKDIMNDDNYPYLFNRSMTMKEAAHYAMSRVDFYFKEIPTKDDFLSEEQYNSFTRRFEELEIKIKPNYNADVNQGASHQRKSFFDEDEFEL